MPARAAMTVVAEAPAKLRLDSGRLGRPPPASEVWSPAMYLWHLVDVLRIGAERLWTLALDPGAGVTCWDEQALARERHYAELSAVVGCRALGDAVATWMGAADQALASGALVAHPHFGELAAADVIRRNAHEVAHHLGDIHRQG